MKAIAITGLGLYTSLGCGIDTNWQQLAAGQSGVKRIMRFPTAHLPVTVAATIDLNQDNTSATQTLIEEVLTQALTQSALSPQHIKNAQLVLTTQPRETNWPLRFDVWKTYYDAGLHDYDWAKCAENKHDESLYHPATFNHFLTQLQMKYHLQKTPFCLNTACASGASAIQLAAEQILSGQTAVSIAVANDNSVLPETITRFALLTALSTSNEVPSAASKPFSANRDGFVLGEGAAALVLEDLDYARKRGAPILAYLTGCGDSTDNFHRTRSHPSGEKIVACMQKALAAADISPEHIDYINAHGTGTPENDKMESKGIQLLFSDHCKKLLVSANKSMIGHTLSAAGAIEAVFSILTLQHQLVPPTINYHEPDPNISLNVVPNQAVATEINTVLSNSFGFGGQNVSLVFTRV